MGEISDAAIMAALGRRLTTSVARENVAAGNLANIDTPGYKARQVDFQSLLDGQLGGLSLDSTDPAHLSGETDPTTGSEVASGLPARRDGNTVQLDHELLSMTQASIDFSAAQTVLAEKFRLVRYAINEGK